MALILIVLGACPWAYAAPVLEVDIYQAAEAGSNNDELTDATMSPSHYGEGWGTEMDKGTLWVSDEYARSLPGTVLVSGVEYSGASTRSWKYFQNYQNNMVSVISDTYPAPYASRITMGCYFTVCPALTEDDYFGQHDTIVIGGDSTQEQPKFAVLQLIRPIGDDLYIQAHSSDVNGKTTISPMIRIVPGKTYWVNLHHDAVAGLCKVAVFDPDSNWSQVGETVIAESVPGAQMRGRVRIGRGAHTDHVWGHEVYSYFDNIVIDYTNGVFPLVPVAISSTYWVSPDGTASWADAESKEPLNGAKACSLSTANANAQAGDTVYLRGGTYDDGTYIRPRSSGVSNKARITYRNYDDETVTIVGAAYSIFLDNSSYVTVSGIHFYRMGHLLFMQNNSNHNIISYCDFNDTSDPEEYVGSKIYLSSQYNWVHHCVFSRWGQWTQSKGHQGSLLDVGRATVSDDATYYNLIEENTFYYGSHDCVSAFTPYNIFRNNYMHNESWDRDPAGYRSAISLGLSAGQCLFEGNRIGFSGKAAGMSLRSQRNIFRRNLFYNNGHGGIQCVTDQSDIPSATPAEHNFIYNNVFFNNGHQATDPGTMGGVYFTDWGYGDPVDNALKNNIFYGNARTAIVYSTSVTTPQIEENNWTGGGDPLFVYGGDGSDLTPFADAPDFRLLETSPCRDAGGSLTTITSSSSTGTQFEVEDAGFFMDGWGMGSLGIEGDLIQLEGQTQRARITNVDYDYNIITIDKALAWTQGQGVSLAYEGSSPDIGAYEYAGENDSESPSVPSDLSGTAVSHTAIDLTWTTSKDNVGVVGYRIFRDGAQVATSATNGHSDTGLTADTTYSYSVSAYDAAGNSSAQCGVVNVATGSVPGGSGSSSGDSGDNGGGGGCFIAIALRSTN